jgi:SP family galactose:H+ symporter-like MFS transporter
VATQLKAYNTKITVIIIAVIAALSGLLFGSGLGIVNGSLELIQSDFHLSMAQAEKITSILSIGALIGALLSGFISKKLGRHKILIIAGIIFTLFSIMAVTAVNYDVLLFARFCLGLAIGLSSFVAPLYLGEIAPSNIRGALLTLYQLMIVSGMFIVFVTNDLLRQTNSWRLMFSIIFIFALLFCIGTLFLPNSPRWLVLKGKKDQARDILRKLRSNEKEIEFELKEIKKSLIYKKVNKEFRWFSKLFLKVLAVGVFLQLLQQFSGVNTIGYYSTTIFINAGLNNPYFATIIMGAIKIFATILAIMYVDKWGRKPILYLGLAISVLSTFFLGLAFHMETAGHHSHFIHLMILLTSVIFQAAYSISLGPIVWMICAEIFPLEARDLGITITTATNWFGNAVLTRYVLSAILTLGASYTFWIFSAICLLGIVLIIAYVPETKNVSLETLEMNLKDCMNLRKLGTKRL